jgi:hypothetical protein
LPERRHCSSCRGCTHSDSQRIRESQARPDSTARARRRPRGGRGRLWLWRRTVAYGSRWRREIGGGSHGSGRGRGDFTPVML